MGLIPESEQVRQAAQGILRLVARAKRGQTLSWADVEQAAGVSRQVAAFWTALRKVKHKTQNSRGLYLEFNRREDNASVGVVVLTVTEHLASDKYMRKAMRSAGRQRRMMQCIHDADLTDQQRVVKYKRIELAAKARKDNLRALRKLNEAKPETGGVPFRGGVARQQPVAT